MAVGSYRAAANCPACHLSCWSFVPQLKLASLSPFPLHPLNPCCRRDGNGEDYPEHSRSFEVLAKSLDLDLTPESPAAYRGLTKPEAARWVGGLRWEWGWGERESPPVVWWAGSGLWAGGSSGMALTP